MKKIWVFLGLMIFILSMVACEKETPPPPPSIPGADVPVGQAIAGIDLPNWATEPDNTFVIVEPEEGYFELAADETGDLKVRVQGIGPNDFVFKIGYMCQAPCIPPNQFNWEPFYFEGPEYSEYWLKGGNASAELTIDRDNFRIGENYLVAYACKLLEGGWDCNNDEEVDTNQNGPKFMLLPFDVYAKCVDSDDGIVYDAKGTIEGVDDEYNIYDDETDECTSDKILKEYYCNLPMEPSGDCIKTMSCKKISGGWGLPSNTYTCGGWLGSKTCQQNSDCWYCSNNPGTSCTANEDCEFEVFARVETLTRNCLNDEVCFDGTCLDVPFYNKESPSKNNPLTTEKVEVPEKIQLSTTESVDLDISTDFELVFSQFQFGDSYSFDEDETVSFVQTVQDFGYCIAEECEVITSFEDMVIKGCGGEWSRSCKTDADCNYCSGGLGMSCSNDADCQITEGYEGGWILGNASKTLTFDAGSTVAELESDLNGTGLEFGTNSLFVYGCDADSPWNCNGEKWTKKNVMIIPPCVDFDGNDTGTKGTVQGMYSGGTLEVEGVEDECVSTTPRASTVKEYVCVEDTNGFVYIDSVEVDCTVDEICFNGACEAYTPPPTPPQI